MNLSVLHWFKVITYVEGTWNPYVKWIHIEHELTSSNYIYNYDWRQIFLPKGLTTFFNSEKLLINCRSLIYLKSCLLHLETHQNNNISLTVGYRDIVFFLKGSWYLEIQNLEIRSTLFTGFGGGVHGGGVSVTIDFFDALVVSRNLF